MTIEIFKSNNGFMKPQLFHPPQHLQRYIRYYCVAESEIQQKSAHMIDVYADVYPRMVFQHNNGNSGFFTKDEVWPVSYLCGLKTAPTQFSITSNSMVIVSFFPEAFKILFGVDANELINLHPELEHFASKTLTMQILDASSSTEKIKLLNDFFTKQLINSKARLDAVFVKALSNFYHANSENNVNVFLKEHKISERQLQRHFKQNIGITPKQFLRVLRFEKTLALLQNGKKSMSDLAFSMDYFDQSHFIREFKEFSGISPNQFRNKNIVSGESNAVLINES